MRWHVVGLCDTLMVNYNDIVILQLHNGSDTNLR